MPGLLDLSVVNLLLDAYFGSGSPASHDIAILITEPLNDGTGWTEVSGGSYARVAYANNVSNWPAASAGIKKNGNEISFPAATANWGANIWGLGFFASGNIKAWAKFALPQTIIIDAFPFVILPNSIIITAR